MTRIGATPSTGPGASGKAAPCPGSPHGPTHRDGQRPKPMPTPSVRSISRERARLSLGYTEVAPNFNPEVGFLARESYRRMNASVFTTFRPESFMGVHEFRPHVFHNTYFDYRTGRHESQFTHNRQPPRVAERLRDPHRDERHSRRRVRRVSRSSPGWSFRRAPTTIRKCRSPATRISAHRSASTSTPSLEACSAATASRSRLRLPPASARRSTPPSSGPTTTCACRGGTSRPTSRASGCRTLFTTRMFFQGLVQYNDRADVWSSNLRLRSAVGCQHRTVRGLQRHPGPRERDPHRRRPHTHPQVQLPV